MRRLKRIVIIGAGSGGISVASRLVKTGHFVTIIDPKEVHYYQPLFTLVGGGESSLQDTRRKMSDVIPAGVTHIKNSVKQIKPKVNSILLADGSHVEYDYLVVSPGLSLDLGAVENLSEYLKEGTVQTNYSEKYVENTYKAFKNFKGGKAIFTFPNSPVKCGGAPQKIMWLFEHFIEKNGLKDKTEIYFTSAAGDIFGVPKYRDALKY